jgi:hypothetical protein
VINIASSLSSSGGRRAPIAIGINALTYDVPVDFKAIEMPGKGPVSGFDRRAIS